MVTYLSDRKHIIIIVGDGVKSNTIETAACAPEEFRLGTLLFLTHMNDIVCEIESGVLVFADDTSLMAL